LSFGPIGKAADKRLDLREGGNVRRFAAGKVDVPAVPRAVGLNPLAGICSF
jgi:hypothetical protein